MPSGDAPCFVINAFELQGQDATRFAWLQAHANTFTGQCLGVQGLSFVLAELNDALIEQGYLTSRLTLGAQNVGQGLVSLRLHTGRVADIRMVDADRSAREGSVGQGTDHGADERWGTWRNAFPTRTGALLNAHDLEQGVEQMNRLPSQRVTTTLAPGADPDTSVVLIQRQAGGWHDRVRGALSLDNSGNAALGRAQASANLAIDNPFGFNDLVSLSAGSNAEHASPSHRSQSLNLGYSVPWGYSTFSVSVGSSRFDQVVQLPTVPHVSSGRSRFLELRWDVTALRTSSSKAGGYAALTTRRSRSFLDDTELLTQRRKTTFLETGVNIRRIVSDSASFDAAVGVRRGVPWLRAQDDLTGGAPTPTLRPRILTYSASWSAAFEQPDASGVPGRRWLYSASLRGQRTHDYTLSVDQIAIGNRYTVRGFDGDSVLMAESGWFLRNDLSTPVKLVDTPGKVYVGFDVGRVWGPSAALLPGHRLVGAALGVRARLHSVEFDLALSAPLSTPDGMRTAHPAVYASALYAF